eukprot:14641654-Alexandrium_andersonii.AAC.1
MRCPVAFLDGCLPPAASARLAAAWGSGLARRPIQGLTLSTGGWRCPGGARSRLRLPAHGPARLP